MVRNIQSDSDESTTDTAAVRTDGGRLQRDPPTWQDIFPFQEPYADQADGIKRVINNGRQHGYTVLEGACGTGKTLMALTAGLTLARDPETEFSKVVVATSLRQQLRAFEDDLKAINNAASSGNSITPVSAVSLVGKEDVCPYSTGGGFSPGEVYKRCNPLRQSTREIVYDDGDENVSSPAANPVESAMRLVSHSKDQSAEPTMLDDAVSEFPERPQRYADTDYCPYYAQHIADDIADESSIPTEDRVLTRDRLMTDAIEYGTCPHTTMRDAMYDAEVVIANYQHIFNPAIVDTFSEPLVDDSTFLIVDEAHTLLQQVREELSTNTTHTTFAEGAAECQQVYAWLFDADSKYRNRAEAILKDSDVSADDIQAFEAFLDALSDRVASEVRDALEREHPDASAPYFDLDPIEEPLESPQTASTDTLWEWSQANDFDETLWERAETIGETIADIKSTIKREVENKTGEGTKYAEAAGSFLTEWYERDHTFYFRELRITDRGTLNDDYAGWKQSLRAELWLNNLIPAGELANQLDAFGGGILMSATLAPLDVYSKNAGLGYLTDRPVETAIYDLSFPPENRASSSSPRT